MARDFAAALRANLRPAPVGLLPVDQLHPGDPVAKRTIRVQKADSVISRPGRLAGADPRGEVRRDPAGGSRATEAGRVVRWAVGL